MTFYQVPVSHDDSPHLVSSLSILSSTLPSPKNTKLSHSALSLHAMLKSLTLSTPYPEYSIYKVQHTPSRAYTEYSIHSVLHTLYTASSQDRLSNFQPVRHLLADHVVLNSRHSHNYELTKDKSFSCCLTSLPNYHLQIDYLQVLIHSRSITASKWNCNLPWFWPPSASPNLPDYGLLV
jgi:hypothetical protein